MSAVDRQATIEQLEDCVWPYDSFGSHVVQESQRLRKVPLCELHNEDIRLLIGQKIGLPFLLPIAFERLSENPLASGHMFTGDLLLAVVSISEEFWSSHPALNNELVELKSDVEFVLGLLAQEVLPALGKRQLLPGSSDI